MPTLTRGPNHGGVGERTFVIACQLAVALPLALLVVLTGLALHAGLPGLLRASTPADFYPALTGSLYLVCTTAALALPMGVAAAVYLEEYARDRRLGPWLEANLATLAGVPSVLYGLLGLWLFVEALGLGRSLFAGAATLSLLVVPTVIVATREALRAVPRVLRDACLGLGATRWQAVRQVVLPAALPGIVAGSILSVSRALGATTPLLMLGALGHPGLAGTTADAPYWALTLQAFSALAPPRPELPAHAASSIVVLLVTTMVLNGLAALLRNRDRRRSLARPQRR